MDYSDKLKKEISSVIVKRKMVCSVEYFRCNMPTYFGSIKLSSEFVSEFQNEIFWNWIHYRNLSLSSIRKFKDRLNWSTISNDANLSSSFIKEFHGYLDWDAVSSSQNLSESIIRKFANLVNWSTISYQQKLSEGFIREFQDRVNWQEICIMQKLSEPFIREFRNKVNWYNICKHQKLSEDFINDFLNDGIVHHIIPRYQKISSELQRKFGFLAYENWLHATVETKEKYIQENTKYKIQKDKQGKYILAYKGIRKDNYSKFNFQYKYEVGKWYESNCDCNLKEGNSFGLSAWDLYEAKAYCNQKIILVKIYLEDIGAIVHDGGKIRCFKFKVMEEIKE